MYRMPAEWEKHEATWLAWPHRTDEWQGKFNAIPSVFAEITRVISMGEGVRIMAKTARHKQQIAQVLDTAGVGRERVEIHIIPTNRIWARDSGPIFVKDKQGALTLLDFRFNGWAKWPDHRLDNAVPGNIATIVKLPIVQPKHKGRHVVLEGGSIDVNGKGMLLTTEECLQSDIQCRNPGFGKDDYEEMFAKYLGITQTIWLGEGVKGDDTHGHVDDITRFVNADTVVTAVSRDKRSPHHAPLADNLKRLKRTKLNVVELPMPRDIYFDGTILPASYANFLITNRVVLVPTFNDVNDRVALNILSDLFTGREVIGIHAGDLVQELGTLHCLSQQQPI